MIILILKRIYGAKTGHTERQREEKTQKYLFHFIRKSFKENPNFSLEALNEKSCLFSPFQGLFCPHTSHQLLNVSRANYAKISTWWIFISLSASLRGDKNISGVDVRNMCVKSSLIKRMEFSIQYSSDNNKCLQIAYGNAKRFNGRWMN